MAQSFIQALTKPSSNTFAEALIPTPAQPQYTPSTMNVQNMPLMQAGVIPPQTGVTPPQTSSIPTTVTGMYNPSVGTSTQKVADAMYGEKMAQIASNTQTVPSSSFGTGTTMSSAAAKRNTLEATLQQYLDQQKQYQQQLLQANQAGPTEAAAAARYNQLKTQAALNQEQALASGETSSFAGGEAQRVARTDAIKLAGAAADLQYMTGQREQAVKTIEALMASGDNSFKTQLEIQKLQQEVSGIDKQAQDTFFNLAQANPDVEYTYDVTKTAVQNLQDFRKLVASKPGGLSPLQTQKEINTLVSNFRQEPIVKQYQTVATAISSLNEAGVSPTDDIQRIYTFAKIMDPDSAVREGEYSTIQDYATAYVEKLGLKANRIFNNEGFLTDEARKFMLTTLNRRYKQVEKSYNDLANQYSQNIESVKTGQITSGLPDYASGYTPSASVGQQPVKGAVIKTKVGDIRTDW